VFLILMAAWLPARPGLAQVDAELTDEPAPAFILLEPDFELLLEPAEVLDSLEDGPREFEWVEPCFECQPVPPPGPIPPLEKPPRIWELRVEFGLNGSEGNSERFATRYGGKIRRKTDFNILTTDVLYSISYAKHVRNEDKALVDTRSEWPWYGSPWFAFTNSTVEYDAFTAFDVRVTGHAGGGLELVNTKTTQFKTRTGVGGSHELGGPQREFVPEALLGLNLEHAFSPRQKLVAVSDMYPDIGDISDYRVRTNVSWEIKLDPDARMSVRFSLIDRFDSTPNGKKKNDLDYSSLIVWDF
jgi:hypothetical protein